MDDKSGPFLLPESGVPTPPKVGPQSPTLSCLPGPRPVQIVPEFCPTGHALETAWRARLGRRERGGGAPLGGERRRQVRSHFRRLGMRTRDLHRRRPARPNNHFARAPPMAGWSAPNPMCPLSFHEKPCPPQRAFGKSEAARPVCFEAVTPLGPDYWYLQPRPGVRPGDNVR